MQLQNARPVAQPTPTDRLTHTVNDRQEHPDKGGDGVKFKLIQRAYDVLSEPDKRAHYDSTGEVEKSVEEELLETFGGGAFRDTGRERAQMEKESLADAIVSQEKNKVRTGRDAPSPNTV
jgi:curved DNA-binding protein CbpA